jgi:hypothetical protein
MSAYASVKDIVWRVKVDGERRVTGLGKQITNHIQAKNSKK